MLLDIGLLQPHDALVTEPENPELLALPYIIGSSVLLPGRLSIVYLHGLLARCCTLRLSVLGHRTEGGRQFTLQGSTQYGFTPMVCHRCFLSKSMILYKA